MNGNISEKKTFTCEKCEKTFKGTRGWDYHVNNDVCQKSNKKYNCTICKQNFKSKTGLDYHLAKDVCNTYSKKYMCDTCGKILTSSSSLWNHKSKFCKINPDKVVQDKIQQLDDEFRKMKLMMETAIINSIVNSNNKTKINNNTINVNNNNNILLVKFGDEDFSKLTQTELYHVLNKGFYAANALVEKMHFDPNTPENHNVCFSNLRDKYGSIYNGTEWVIQNKEDIIDKLIDDKRLLIECSKNTKAFKKLEVLKQEAVLRMLEFDVDNEHINVTKKDLMIMMYNKRKYPQQAIKLTN